jgi:hypothetical protein
MQLQTPIISLQLTHSSHMGPAALRSASKRLLLPLRHQGCLWPWLQEAATPFAHPSLALPGLRDHSAPLPSPLGGRPLAGTVTGDERQRRVDEFNSRWG